jgi:hypothetical protein
VSPGLSGARSESVVSLPAIPPVVEQTAASPSLPPAIERFFESVHRYLWRKLLELDFRGSGGGFEARNTTISEPEPSMNATNHVDPTLILLLGNDDGLVGVEPDEEDLARELLGLPVDPTRIPLPGDVEDAELERISNGPPAPAPPLLPSPSQTSPLSSTAPT